MKLEVLDDVDSVAQAAAAAIAAVARRAVAARGRFLLAVSGGHTPAGRVQRQEALLLADRAATGQLTADYKRGG